MSIYILATIISIVISIFIEKVYRFKKNRTLKMFISVLPLTIISAIRYDVGWDYLKIYTTGFYMVGQYGVDWFTEGMFRLMIKILYIVFCNPISLFIMFSILISLFFSLCYSNYGKEKNVFIYIILFVISRYYFCSLNIIRQALSMLIILYSLKFAAKKNFKKYLLYILLAGGFHYTSYMFIPFYFLISKNFKFKNNMFFALITIPLIILLGIVFISNTKYANYFNTMFGNDGSIYYSELLITSVLVFFGILLYKKIKMDDVMLCMFNMELIAFIMSVISFLLPTGDRIIWLFSIVNLFYIPKLISYVEKRKLKVLVSTIIYSILLLIFIMQSVYVDSYSVLPYQHIWQS